MLMRIVFICLLVFLLTSYHVKADAPIHYRISRFDVHLSLEGSHCVNQSGVVVGAMAVRDKSGRPTFNVQSYWEKNGRLESLNIVNTKLPSNSPIGINDAGQIVGCLDKGNGFQNYHCWGHAFLWEKGKWQDLSRLIPEGGSFAQAINNKGEVAINAQTSSLLQFDAPDPGEQQPSYLYRKGQGMFSLGNKQVIALNNKSQVLLKSWQNQYYLWDKGQTTSLNVREDDQDSFCDMNDKLQMIGNSHGKAFLYENGILTFLTRQESAAQSLNNKGQIVGSYYRTVSTGKAETLRRAFLWQNNHFLDLTNILSKGGWTLENAVSINDRGQIVGLGLYRGKYTGFLMTPVP